MGNRKLVKGMSYISKEILIGIHGRIQISEYSSLIHRYLFQKSRENTYGFLDGSTAQREKI